jgi:putative DNA primase/helicase
MLRYNERTARFEIGASPPVPPEFLVGGTYPRELCDEDFTSVRVALLESGWGNYSTQVVSRALRLVAKQRSYDPVRSYLAELSWDGTPRLDEWLFQYLGACTPEHPLGDALVRSIGAKWMLSAVARTFEPGCQVDHVLVLEGTQGVRKSSALRVLAGTEHFIDEVGKISDAKNTGEVLQGAWIAEIGERAALKIADLDAAKAWVTRREDRYRAAYERTALSRPRRCVFAATTNAIQYLDDETGNRRYWPIRVTRASLDALARDRDQLWAEAVHRSRARELWWLLDDDPLAQAIAQEQDIRRTTDPWESILARYCATHREVTIGDLLAGPLDKPKGQWTDGDQKRIARILTAWRWQRRQRRSGGHREWYYHPPTGDTGDGTGDASTQ